MKVFSPFLNGDTTTSGSFNVPNHPGTGSIPNPLTGSLFHDDTDGVLKIYTGTQWQVVGEQTASAAGPASADIEYLLVAGGGAGGGGTYNSGGGGAGGLLSSSLDSVQSGSSFTVTVGAGGTGAATQGNEGTNSTIAGSTITTITSIGGGGGGSHSDNPYSGTDGGSGGGGTQGTGAGGSGTVGQGNNGTGLWYGTGGGGGGAGEAGTVGEGNVPPYTRGSQSDIDGGDGLQTNITGTPTYYAGGGGGGERIGLSVVRGNGGAGGGGQGGPDAGAGSAGTSNTGGGGGGSGGDNTSTRSGGSGGSGVAILAYPTASISATGGVRTFFNDRVAHTFNSSGTFSVGGIKTYTHNTLDVFGDSSCIALYNLDGNANDTGGNYNGTASNVTYAQSYINNGGVFNGSSSVITGTPNWPSGNNARAISLWISTTASNNGGVFGYGNGASNQWFGLFLGEGNNYNKVGVVGYFNNIQSTYTLPSTGAWVHLVASFDGTTLKLYADNVEIYSAAESYSTSGTTGFTIGGVPWNSSGERLNGKLDQIRVFNKALSTSEIATLYAE